MAKPSPITTGGESERPTTAPAPIRTSTEDQTNVRMSGATNNANTIQQPTSNTSSPTSESGSKVKNWLKSKMGRISRRHSKSLSEPSATKDTTGTEKGFVGGHTYTGASVNNSTTSLSRHSVQDVANATLLPGTSPVVAVPTQQPEEFERANRGKATPGDDISSVSEYSDKGKGKRQEDVLSGDDEDEFQETRDNFDEDLAPPRPFSSEGTTSVSPGRVPKFREEI